MPFSQAEIIEVGRPVWDGSALRLEWSSSAPPGTLFQVYVDGRLAWYGKERWLAITMPSARIRVDIGAVGPGEGAVNFASQLPAALQDRARLEWLGGTYLDPTGSDDVAGFIIYGEASPGNGIDYSGPLARIIAYPAGIITDGFGLGGFGRGGFGRAASTFRWTSPPLGSGVWSFAVVPFDAAGNPAPPTIGTIAIASPPRPPLPFPDGSRLHYAYDPATRTVTLNWNRSPSD